MSAFLLDTSAVSSVAGDISSLAGEFSSLASTISGFDTSCEDGEFDFNGAKNAIVSNINACCTKVTNTAKIMDTVVSEHTSLQSSLKFEPGGNNKGNSNNNGSSNRGSGSGSSYYSNSHTVSNYSYGSGNNYAGSQSLNGLVTGNMLGSAALLNGSSSMNTNGENNGTLVYNYSKKVDPSTIVGLPCQGILAVQSLGGNLVDKWYYGFNKDNWHFFTGIHDVVCEPASSEKVSSKILEKIEYESGYAKVEDRYVISCDKYFGKVGDKVQVITDDNKVIECVIGYTSDNLDTNLTFFTNNECDTTLIKGMVNTSNLKSINNLEYPENGPSYKYGWGNDYTSASFNSRSVMTTLNGQHIEYGIPESVRNQIQINRTDDTTEEL